MQFRTNKLRKSLTTLLLVLLIAGCQTTPSPTATATSTSTPNPTATPTSQPMSTDTPLPSPTTSPISPVPTPGSPLPTPTALDPAALLPETPLTPPPPDFSPTPPPPVETAGEAQYAWTRDYIRLVTNMLNTGQSVDEVLATTNTWTESPGGVPEGLEYAWSRSTDLDGDGADEWLIGLPVPGMGCGATLCPSYVVLYEQVEGLFQPQYVIPGTPDIPTLSFADPRFIEDVNADGATEVVIEQRSCGAHTCFTSFIVGRWDGTTWRDLTAEPISQSYAETTIEDRDDDGALEFTLHGGTSGSVGAGLQRQHTRIYDWQDGAYRLVQDIPDPSNHPYYLMLDAHRALTEEELTTALDLALQVVDDADFQSEAVENAMVPPEETNPARIVGYAVIEAMLVYAQQDDVAAMEDVLARTQIRSWIEPNVYLEAAEQLLSTYQQTEDPVQACAAMEDVVAGRAAEAVFFDWYGYGTERITVDDLCPLDAPDEGESPYL